MCCGYYVTTGTPRQICARRPLRAGSIPLVLAFAGRLPLKDHLARLRLADLFLDTLPSNAHTTASDALWSGLPVLSCRGNAAMIAQIGLRHFPLGSGWNGGQHPTARACSLNLCERVVTAVEKSGVSRCEVARQFGLGVRTDHLDAALARDRQRRTGQDGRSQAFRKKVYASIDELQVDLDEWIRVYNELRPRIKDAGASAKRRCKPSWMQCRSRRRK